MLPYLLSQFLHTYPDHQAIAAKLCLLGGHFMLNTEGGPWKILRKDVTTLAQTCSILYYFNLAPTSHTSDLNMNRAHLIYRIVMKMDMDLDNMISSQITQIAQSNSSRLGFPTLITTLCDAKGVRSDTLTFESLSPIINLAYIQKNCWNPTNPSVVFLGPKKARGHAVQETSLAPQPIVIPPPSTSTPQQPTTPMLQSIHHDQFLIMQSL